MPDFDPQTLGTIAGASVAIVFIIQLVKQVFAAVGFVPIDGARFYRVLALALGVVIVVSATVASGPTFGSVVAAVFVGVQAGLAAIAGFDTVRTRDIAYRVEP